MAAQSDENPGVLVLSQFAGAAQDLTGALIVNSFGAIADAMHVALTMPLSECRERQSVLKEKVMRTTAEAYCRRFIEALEAPFNKLSYTQFLILSWNNNRDMY